VIGSEISTQENIKSHVNEVKEIAEDYKSLHVIEIEKLREITRVYM